MVTTAFLHQKECDGRRRERRRQLGINVEECGIGMIEEGCGEANVGQRIRVLARISYDWLSVFMRATLSEVFAGPTSWGCPFCLSGDRVQSRVLGSVPTDGA